MITCLLVDDNPTFLTVAARFLATEGIEVIGSAASVDDGLSLARALAPNIALVDVELGSESGLTLSRQLAADPAPRQVAVVLMSGRAREDFGVALEQCGAVGFIAKDQLSGGVLRTLSREARSAHRG